jgi:hypothetical protein
LIKELLKLQSTSGLEHWNELATAMQILSLVVPANVLSTDEHVRDGSLAGY